MEFGKLPSVDDVHWELPSEDPVSREFLEGLSKNSNRIQFYIGAPAWSHKEWIGMIYPAKTKANEFLYHYSRNFSCIELNTSHYRIPTADQIQKWVAQVPPGFLFCPKIYQGLSHENLGDRGLLQEWCDSLVHYGDHLGPCFLQMPPHFDYSRKAVLFQFLQAWPAQYELCLEVRHPSWFPDGHVLPALQKYLQGRNIGVVILDVAGRRDLVHTSVTARYGMLRLIGNDLHPSDEVRARDWSFRLAELQKQGLQRFFFMVHEPDDINAPKMADVVVAELNAQCGSDLPSMHWVSEEPKESLEFPGILES